MKFKISLIIGLFLFSFGTSLGQNQECGKKIMVRNLSKVDESQLVKAVRLFNAAHLASDLKDIARFLAMENNEAACTHVRERFRDPSASLFLKVTEVEAPIHVKDLATRVANCWGQRAGSAISARIQDLTNTLARNNRLAIRGDFVWNVSGQFKVRSRADIGIPAERIAPEEIEEAVLQILRSGHSFNRQQLVNEVRGVFGFARTGQRLQQSLTSALDALLVKGKIGEGGLGIALRHKSPS